MTRLSESDREILTLLSEGVSDGEVNRRLGMTSQDLNACLVRLADWVSTYEIPAETRILYERALRTRAESALKSVSARFHALLEGMPSAVLVVDGRTGIIREANGPAASLFGYSEAELVGLSVEELVPPQHRPIHHAYRIGFLTSIRKRQMGYHPPIYGVRKDGVLIEMAISLTASTGNDDVMVVCTSYAVWEKMSLRETANGTEF